MSGLLRFCGVSKSVCGAWPLWPVVISRAMVGSSLFSTKARFSDFATAIRSNDLGRAKKLLLSGDVAPTDLEHVYEKVSEAKELVKKGRAKPSFLKSWDDTRALTLFVSRYPTIHAFMLEKFKDYSPVELHTLRISRVEFGDTKIGVVLVASREGLPVLKALQEKLNKKDPLNPKPCQVARRQDQYYLSLNEQDWASCVGHEPLALFLLHEMDRAWVSPAKKPVQEISAREASVCLGKWMRDLGRMEEISSGSSGPEILDLE